MDMAKIMYVMHHEGEGAGPLFISNTLAKGKGGVEKLRNIFATQLGKDGVILSEEKISAADNDVEFAYRKWFAIFVDDRFRDADKFFCSAPITAMTLTKLMARIGGEKL